MLIDLVREQKMGEIKYTGVGRLAVIKVGGEGEAYPVHFSAGKRAFKGNLGG